MGEVVVTLQLMPEEAGADLDHLEEEVRSRIEVHSIEREPVAFGLESLRVKTIVPDAAGGTNEIEESLSSIDGVKNIRVTDVRRVL